MRTLKVWKFSSIIDGTLPISPITLLVGPQASGKSVLCKLSYFFCSLLDEQVRAVVEARSQHEFGEQVKAKFLRWFPYETWGKHKFELSFTFGSCEVKIMRTVSGGKAGKGVKVHFCEALTELYEQSLERIRAKSSQGDQVVEGPEFTYSSWMLQRSVREGVRARLSSDYVSSQLFIPAARSFFTSIGKAIAAFENSNTLDPLTLLFGRMYAAREPNDFPENPIDRTIRTLIKNATSDMLGGQIVRERERDREVLHTKDGRTIPLSALSSGQQELFPLLRVLPNSAAKGSKRIVYVEEPEAHLFPDAQSRLVELLSGLMNAYGETVEMVITTHSPYVLSKFNNLITAGKIGRRKSKSSAVAAVIPAVSWISNGRIGAYALAQGRTKNIIDEDGLIDGQYLDDVSNQIGAEFTSLLDVEFQSSSHRPARPDDPGRPLEKLSAKS